jgi:hypothetical protein
MTKKAFRPRQAPSAAYPRLVELAAPALRRWGLVAIGGVLLGGVACTRTAGAPPPASHTVGNNGVKGESVPARLVPHIDAGEFVPPTAVPPPGEPPMDRVEQSGADASRHGTNAKRGRHAAKGEVPPRLKQK